MFAELTRSLLVVSILLGTSEAYAANKSGATNIAWQGGFQAAFEQAAAEKKPVFIAINMDNEAANEDLVQNAYRSSELMNLSTKCVCMVASAFKHQEVMDANGNMVCSRFGSVHCADHMAIERAVRATFLKGQVNVVAPQHIFVAPDRTPLEIREYVVSAGQLGSMMSGAIDKVTSPSKAKKAEQARLLALVNDAIKNPKEAGPVTALVNSMFGWSSDVALEVVKARASRALKLAVVQQLAARGKKAESVLLALLEDPYAKVREQVAMALGTVRDDETREILTRRLRVERDTLVKKAITAVLNTTKP